MHLLGIDRSEGVVEGLDDVVSIPSAGNDGTQSCGKAEKIITDAVHSPGRRNTPNKTALNDFLPPIRMMMPPVMAMRDLRVLSSPPQLVHFIPMQAAPRPHTVTMMLMIMRARVAWRAPG